MRPLIEPQAPVTLILERRQPKDKEDMRGSFEYKTVSLGEIVGLLTEIRDGLSVVSSTLAQIKEERESSPHTPYKEKGETHT